MVNLVEEIQEHNVNAYFYDGYEDALMGICEQFGRPPVAAYDFEKCIDILIETDGMSREEALEFFALNTLRTGLGENTPVFIYLAQARE